MLVGVNNRKPASETESTLNKMESSGIQFFLTGSRFFGWERPDSDWDFFTADNRGIGCILRSFGLREDRSEGYQDGLTRKVFIGHFIHVQLVTNVVTKQALNRFFVSNKRLLAIPSHTGRIETGSFGILWNPRPKEVQKAAWQTAVTMLLSSQPYVRG